MEIPSGYTALSLVGFTDRGTYSATETYVKNDLVHYKNSIFCAKQDDLTGVEPTDDGTSWYYFVFSPDDVEENARTAANAAATTIQKATETAASAAAAADSASAASSSEQSAGKHEANASASAAAAEEAATKAAGYGAAATYSIGINPSTGHMAVFYNE